MGIEILLQFTKPSENTKTNAVKKKKKRFKLVAEKFMFRLWLPVFFLNVYHRLCLIGKVCHLKFIQQQCSTHVQNDPVMTAEHLFLHFSQTKVGSSETGGSFEEVLSSAANASSQDTPTNTLTDSSERPR